MFIHITESGFKLTLQLLNFTKSSIAKLLLMRWVACDCCDEFWEVDEIFVRQCSL